MLTEQWNSDHTDHMSIKQLHRECDKIIQNANLQHLPQTVKDTFNINFLVKETNHKLLCIPDEASPACKNIWIIKTISVYRDTKDQSFLEIFIKDFNK